MIPVKRRRHLAGLSLIEVLVVIGMCAALVAVSVPRFKMAHKRATQITCVSHLKNLGLGIRTFAVDLGDYPWHVALTNGGLGVITNPVSGDLLRILSAFSNVLATPRILICPKDIRTKLEVETFANMVADPVKGHLLPSYFLGLDSSEDQTQTILSGDRNLSSPGLPEMDWRKVTVSTPAWRLRANKADPIRKLEWDANAIHQGAGNILLGDGSVEQVSSGRLRDAVTASLAASTNGLEWLMPVDH